MSESAAEWLERVRSNLGWTQVEAAAYLGRHPNTYAGYEQGRLTVPYFVLTMMNDAYQKGANRATQSKAPSRR
jgi:transcriptional regulator with XRE-family HTH domain